MHTEDGEPLPGASVLSPLPLSYPAAKVSINFHSDGDKGLLRSRIHWYKSPGSVIFPGFNSHKWLRKPSVQCPEVARSRPRQIMLEKPIAGENVKDLGALSKSKDLNPAHSCAKLILTHVPFVSSECANVIREGRTWGYTEGRNKRLLQNVLEKDFSNEFQ